MSLDIGEAFVCYGTEMHRVAGRWTYGTSIEPEDLVQETFLQAARKIGSYDPTRPFLPWLKRVMRNKLIDLLRRVQKHKDNVNDPELLLLVATMLTPDQIVESADFRPLLRRHVESLGGRRAEAVIAVYYDGQLYKNAAAKLGMPIGTFKRELHLAVKELRERVIHVDMPENASAYAAVGE